MYNKKSFGIPIETWVNKVWMYR